MAEQPELLTEPVEQQVAPSPGERRFDIVSRRNLFFLISLLVIIPGIISMVTQGFLLGIDFQGGTEFTMRFTDRPSLASVQAAVDRQNVHGTVQQTGDGTFYIRTAPIAKAGDQKKFEDSLAKSVGPYDQTNSQAQFVGPTIASEIVTGALVAVVAASALILLYLTFRFRKVQGGFRSGFQFGGSALLALLHDVFVLCGIFSILGTVLHLRIGEVDSLFLTAILTVVGFSVHDTIVVFDRIRENLIAAPRLTFEQTVNLSIMQTAARSIITSFTVVLVLAAMLIAGGENLRGFILALLIGIISGTYSSIFNAAPLLVVWRRWQSGAAAR